MEKEKAVRIAEECGMSHAGTFPVKILKLRTEVRDMCADNKCGRYNKSWSCPPACGSLEELQEKIKAFSWGLLVQMTGEMEDDFDVETIEETEEKMKNSFRMLCDRLIDGGETCFPMGAGTCTRCAECTYPDAPCRFPEKVFPSMEACGLWVSEVCETAGIPYYYGKGTITYSCCVLFP